MSELDQPIRLTFKDSELAHGFIKSLNLADEKVIWEQGVKEDNTVVVSILSITSDIEREEEDE